MTTILHLMGPTCAGKSTLIDRLLSLSPKVGAVQIGKLMRAKYGEAHFKGQAAPEHTKVEALQMYYDETNRLVAEGKELILIDGQPRDVEQAHVMTSAWYQDHHDGVDDGYDRMVYDVRYYLITADHAVREERARKGREPGPNLDLAIARLTNDYKSNYLVMCELIKMGIPIGVIDTSEKDFDLDECCGLILRINGV